METRGNFLSSGETLGLPLESRQVCRELLSCLKCVKDTFEAHERWDFSLDAAVEKALSHVGGDNLLAFSSCGSKLGVTRCTTGTSGTMCGLRKGQSPGKLGEGPFRFPSAVTARAEVLVWS